VVTNTSVPTRDPPSAQRRTRAQDGIATPFVTLFIAILAAADDLGDAAWGLEAVTQIGLAILSAAVVGYLGGTLMALAKDHGWTSDVSEQGTAPNGWV